MGWCMVPCGAVPVPALCRAQVLALHHESTTPRSGAGTANCEVRTGTERARDTSRCDCEWASGVGDLLRRSLPHVASAAPLRLGPRAGPTCSAGRAFRASPAWHGPLARHEPAWARPGGLKGRAWTGLSGPCFHRARAGRPVCTSIPPALTLVALFTYTLFS